MRSAYVAGWGVIAILALVPVACSDNDDRVVTPASVTPDMSGTTAQVRFAHLSPNKPPIDICLAVHGSNQFTGPLLKPIGVAAIGLSYTEVSKYLPVTAGGWDVRVVDGGATTCAQSLFDATGLPPFQAGVAYTVVGTGLIPPQSSDPNAFTMTAYVDELAAQNGVTLARFIHTAPATPSLDFGLRPASDIDDFQELLDNVAYLAVGRSGQSDANGYVGLVTANAAGTFTMRQHGGNNLVTFNGVSAQLPGVTLSWYAIGSLTPMPKPLQVLECVDNGAPIGPLSPCTVLP